MDTNDWPQTTLESPEYVVSKLREAGQSLSLAHQRAGESEGDRRDLNGAVREAIFGINSTIDALASMIEEGRFNGE